MSRIGFLVLYAPGHLSPSLALAKALKREGHTVVFFNIEDVESTVLSAGLEFRAFANAEYPAGVLQMLVQKMGELMGPESLAYFVQRMLQLGSASFQHLPEIIADENLDLLIIDQFFPGGATIADHLKLPYISLANALVANREDSIPPPTQLWPYDTAPASIERNRKGWTATSQALSPLLAFINEQRRAWGLSEYSDVLEDSFSPLAQISQQPAVFEFPRANAPETLHFVGHLQDESTLNTVPFDWSRLDGRAIIYASLGTLQNRVKWVFETIIDACAPLAFQTVIALGKTGFPPEAFGDLPENIILVPYAPQIELLRKAALCITHAGLNTTLDCLANGVPMVALPIASEQPGIAMRMAHLGAGKVLSLSELNPESLRVAVQTVLAEPGYKHAAEAAAAAIAPLDSISGAVKIVDSVLQRRASVM